MVVAYLIYDMRSLRACSLTYYSLYIAAVPHLHRTLNVDINPCARRIYERSVYARTIYASPLPKYHPSHWSNRIQHMNKLDLLPFVKKLHICDTFFDYSWMSFPGSVYYSLLDKYSTLSNVQELVIEFMDISNFIQRPQRPCRHFLPTVQSLALITPKGSHRQIIYFIRLFQHLEDLKLDLSFPEHNPEEPVDDLTLIPHFAPPLRGQLKMLYSNKVEFLADMINLLGGLRFRSMDLYYVDGMQLLLGACAKTLESLRLHLVNFESKQL